ncbi:MAG: hypothetical protein KGJ86_07775 [Chloroflexota bacterium]|nr:hypothetical protein [Chloroflexota bacterium]
MNRKSKVQFWLFVLVLLGIGVAQTASVVHMVEAFSWANSAEMSVALAAVAVVLSGVFMVLAVVSPSSKSRSAITAGIVLLGVIETIGNFTVGYLQVQDSLPDGVSDLFNLSPDVVERLAAFLFSGFLPVLVFLAIYAISEHAKQFLNVGEEARVRPHLVQSGASSNAGWGKEEPLEQVAALR